MSQTRLDTADGLLPSQHLSHLTPQGYSAHIAHDFHIITWIEYHETL